MALWLSLYTAIDLYLAPSSVIMPFYQMASLKASAAVIYSTSVVEKAIIFCNVAF